MRATQRTKPSADKLLTQSHQYSEGGLRKVCPEATWVNPQAPKRVSPARSNRSHRMVAPRRQPTRASRGIAACKQVVDAHLLKVSAKNRSGGAAKKTMSKQSCLVFASIGTSTHPALKNFTISLSLSLFVYRPPSRVVFVVLWGY